jgi:hypothetical protein
MALEKIRFFLFNTTEPVKLRILTFGKQNAFRDSNRLAWSSPFCSLVQAYLISSRLFRTIISSKSFGNSLTAVISSFWIIVLKMLVHKQMGSMILLDSLRVSEIHSQNSYKT